MDVLLTVFATAVFIALWPAVVNIWDVGRLTYFVARWALVVWVLTFDAVLWYGVYLAHR